MDKYSSCSQKRVQMAVNVAFNRRKLFKFELTVNKTTSMGNIPRVSPDLLSLK